MKRMCSCIPSIKGNKVASSLIAPSCVQCTNATPWRFKTMRIRGGKPVMYIWIVFHGCSIIPVSVGLLSLMLHCHFWVVWQKKVADVCVHTLNGRGGKLPPAKEFAEFMGLTHVRGQLLHHCDFCTNVISFQFLVSLILNICLQIFFNLKLC